MTLILLIGVVIFTEAIIFLQISDSGTMVEINTPYLFTPLKQSPQEVWKSDIRARPIFALLVKS